MIDREASAVKSVMKEIFVKRIYEKRGFVIEENEEWLDLGGYLGHFSRYAQLKGARIIAIYEPFQEYCEIMRSDFPEVEIINKAIWFETCEKILFICGDKNYHRNTLINHYKRKKMIMREIQCIAFSQVVKKNCCVKMDIEGAELQIIDSTPGAFEDVKKLVVEYHLDKDPLLENYYRRVRVLKRYFNQMKFDKLKQTNGSMEGELSIFPSGRLIYCW